MVTKQEWYTLTDDQDGANIDANNAWGGQSFTLGTAGGNFSFDLASIDIKIKADGSTPDTWAYTLEVYEVDPAGLPQGSAISTGTTGDIAIANTTPFWRNVTMTPVTLVRDKQYFILMKATTAADNSSWREDGSAPGYTGGTAFSTADGGATWTTVAADKMFQVNGGDFAGTMCTFSEAAEKAGVNANTNSTNEVLVSNFVVQAESLINSATRKNWTDAFSALNTDVKKLLTQITTALAAINIVTYDMSGYSSRAEAESMLNIFREEVNRALFFLIDQQVEDFVIGA